VGEGKAFPKKGVTGKGKTERRRRSSLWLSRGGLSFAGHPAGGSQKGGREKTLLRDLIWRTERSVDGGKPPGQRYLTKEEKGRYDES